MSACALDVAPNSPQLLWWHGVTLHNATRQLKSYCQERTLLLANLTSRKLGQHSQASYEPEVEAIIALAPLKSLNVRERPTRGTTPWPRDDMMITGVVIGW